MSTPALHFLGWDKPAIELVAERLLSHLTDPNTASQYRRATVVVPTAESGRRLREYMAEKKAGKAILMPTITLVDHLISPQGVNMATQEETLAAWLQVLNSGSGNPVALYAPLIPRMPKHHRERWAVGVAHKLMALHSRLEKEEITVDRVTGLLQKREAAVADSLQRLGKNQESERKALTARQAALSQEQVRWRKLGEIFSKVDSVLQHTFNRTPGHEARATLVENPQPIKNSKLLIFACVPEFSPQMARYLRNLHSQAICQVDMWVHAPNTPEYLARFDSLGRPLETYWASEDCHIDIPQAIGFADEEQTMVDNAASTIHLVDGADELAAEALRLAGGFHSDQVVISTGNPSYTPALVGAFSSTTRDTPWRLYAPEGRNLLATDVGILPEQLANYCAAQQNRFEFEEHAGGMGEMNAFLALLCNRALQHVLGAPPEVRANLQHHIEKLREALLPATSDTLCQYLNPAQELPTRGYRNLEYLARERSSVYYEYAKSVKKFATACCHIQTLPAQFKSLFTGLLRHYNDEFLGAAVQKFCKKLGKYLTPDTLPHFRDASTLLEVLRHEAQSAADGVQNKNARAMTVGNVMGWRELPFSHGERTIIAAMHDGCIPEPVQEDDFLPESLCDELGIRHEKFRMARDSYLLASVLSSRTPGSVHFILTRQNPDGSAVAPSALLLRCQKELLPQRARFLFAESSIVSAMPVIPVCPLKQAENSLPEGEKIRPGILESIDCIARGIDNPFKRSSRTYSPTLLGGFLQCPLSFWLKHLFGLDAGNAYDDEKSELESNEYGTIMHAILEHVVRELPCEAKLRERFPHASDKSQLIAAVEQLALDTMQAEWSKVYMPTQTRLTQPLPLELQLQNIEKSLHDFACRHVQDLLEGWVNIACEKVLTPTLTLSNGETVQFKMTADRIDRHEDGHWRIIDYKTSTNEKKPIKQHFDALEEGEASPFCRFMNTADYTFPVIKTEYTNKSGEYSAKYYHWKDVQLMLYAYGLRQLNAKDLRGDLPDEPLAHVMPDLFYYNLQTKTQRMQCFPLIESGCLISIIGQGGSKWNFAHTPKELLDNAMQTVDSAIRMMQDGVCLFSAESLRLKSRPYSRLTGESWDKNAPRFGAISAQCDPRSMFNLPELDI